MRARESCAGHFGGDTCGTGEVGEAAAKHELLQGLPDLGGEERPAARQVRRHGRPTAAVRRAHQVGDLQSFGKSLGANNKNWNNEWNEMLPESIDEVKLRPRTGWPRHCARAAISPMRAAGRTDERQGERRPWRDGHHAFTKDILDQKALNCVESSSPSRPSASGTAGARDPGRDPRRRQGGGAAPSVGRRGLTPTRSSSTATTTLPRTTTRAIIIARRTPAGGQRQVRPRGSAGPVFSELSSNTAAGKVTWSGSGRGGMASLLRTAPRMAMPTSRARTGAGADDAHDRSDAILPEKGLMRHAVES